MRKGKYLLILIVMLMLIPLNSLAAGSVTVSATSFTITKGSSKTVTITAKNSAGKINISSSNTNVASVSTGSMFLDMQSGTVTITGKSAGTAVITVYLADVTTYDDADLSGKSYKINVTVKETTAAPVVNLSKNNNLKEISINDYELTKIDNRNYELIVDNSVTSVTLKATAEDSKAKVSGIGEKKLVIGLNTFKVAIISESGLKNEITVKVTRKDGYYLDDLIDILKDDTITNPEIILKESDKFTNEELNKIKDSKKSVTMNFRNEDKVLLYSWTIDGSKLNNIKEFVPTIKFVSDNEKDIMTSANYARGMYVNFNHSGDLPQGTMIKLYVGKDFEDGSLVNVYHYDKDAKKLNLVKDKIMVQTNYIELSLEHCSEYFVTMSDIQNSSTNKENNKGTNIFMIISIIEFVLIIGVVIMYLNKSKNISLQNDKTNSQEVVEKL